MPMPQFNLHFRQGSYLGNLPPRHELRQLGVCNALCYDWIRTRLAGGEPNYNELDIFNPESTSLPQYIFSLQRGYKAFREVGKTNEQAMEQIAKGDGLGFRYWSQMYLMTFGNALWQDIARVSDQFNSYAHIMWSGPRGGHAFAIKTTVPCLLFDPNFGEAECASLDQLGIAFASLIDEVPVYNQKLGPNLTIATYTGVPRKPGAH